MSSYSDDDYFESNIFLSVDDKTRHWTYLKGKQRTTTSIHKSDYGGAIVQQSVQFRNGRKKKRELTLDEVSFELTTCPTTLSREEFYAIQSGDGYLTEKYYAEIATFVKKKLGCDEVICFNHQIRNAQKKEEEGIDDYVNGFPHTDSSFVSGDELALSMVPDGKVENYQRYLYLNLWRNIADTPIENDHLAMLDDRTVVKPDDYIVKDLFDPEYNVVQYGLNARHAANHKWYYFPQMKKDEAILFKQVDSDWTKPSRICFHTSAHDSTVKDYAPRESIEVRMMCYFKTADVNSMPTKELINAALIKDPLQVAEDLSTGLPSPMLLMKSFSKHIFGYSLFGETKGANYSGKPEDYLKKIVKTVRYINYWPEDSKEWARGVMKRNETTNDGIVEITNELVKDDQGYLQMKSFQDKEKTEIVEFLLNNKTYMKVATKSFSSFSK